MDELYGVDGVHFRTYDGGHANHYNSALSGVSAYGAAFHWYDNWGMNYDILKQVKEMYPDLPILGTEATNAKPSMEKLEGRLWSNGQRYAVDILRGKSCLPPRVKFYASYVHL